MEFRQSVEGRNTLVETSNVLDELFFGHWLLRAAGTAPAETVVAFFKSNVEAVERFIGYIALQNDM